jgi:hypothetical protein
MEFEMKQQREIMRHIGSIEQLAYVRRMSYAEGHAKNASIFSFNNGILSFSVAIDHGMDIDTFHYKGENLTFLSKAGLHGNAADYSRNIMCGLFFTCGLDNIGTPTESSPLHGRIRGIPAEHTSSNAFWDSENYRLECEGEMRHGVLFGENLLLRRRIYTHLKSHCISLEDEITNNSFKDEPLSLMYHFNFGYPLVSEGTKLIIPSKCCTPRNENTRKAMADSSPYVMDAPVDNHPEQVFFHNLCADEDNNTFCALINADGTLAIKLSFSLAELPYFTQWKSIASGDYVIGLEPGFTPLDGVAPAPRISPGEKIRTHLMLEVIDDQDKILSLNQLADNLLKTY